MKSFSRRGFLAGGAALGAMAAAGLAGCAPSAKESGEEGGEALEVESGLHSWEVYPGDIDKDSIVETIESDVVIIGLGASGTYAATSAIEHGLSVSIIERNESFNANGGSHYVFNSKAQLDAGHPVDTETAVKDWLNLCNNKVDSAAVWKWANRSGEAADWFAEVVEPYGLRPVLQHFDGEAITGTYPGTIIFIGGENEPTDAVDQDPYNGDLGLGFVPEIDLLSALLGHLQSAGAGVYFGHSSERLVKDESGRVTGVIASNADGEYKEFTASKGVVIATGSYCQDPDMLAYYTPFVANNPCGDQVAQFNVGDGSGIKQALWAGAAMQANPDHPPMMFWGATNCIKNVMVNTNGVRFIDENTGQSNMAAAQFTQPGATMIALWNEAYASQLPAIPYRLDDPETWTATPEQLLAKWDKLVEEGVHIKCDTLDEVAEAYGIDAGILKATVEEYNGFCAAGVDESFHKDPATLHELTGSYYATKYTCPASLASMGGLHVNADCEVLTAEEEAVEGLYAVGLAAGDFYANQYSTRFAGNSLGRCMTFGYLVGRKLAGLE